MSEKRLNEELEAVESALARLKPAASGVDRDRVMFLAGRASATANVLSQQHRKIHWLWPCVTAVSLLMAITSSGMLFLQGTATGIKVAAYFKLDKTQTMKNISQPLWYEDTQKETHEVKRPHSSSGRNSMSMDLLSLNMLIAEKGVDALPGQLWIPIGPEKYPRRSPMMYDDVNMF
jgi:hypothetical protein